MHDPVAKYEGEGKNILQLPDAYETARGADALVICTEWPIYRNPDLEKLASLMGRKVIFDGRNCLDPAHVLGNGFEYHGIGR